MFLFETIKCQNRKLQNICYHNKRLCDSRKEVYGILENTDLQSVIEIPDWVGEGIYRCRVSYDSEIRNVLFFEYEFKHPKRIKIISDDSIDYHLKYEDRSVFNKYLANNKGFDDIIFIQNGCLTDTTYSNLAFFDGQNWFTPQTYLLNGTKRQYLIDNQLIKEVDIKEDNFKYFEKVAFINAMRGLDLCYNFRIASNILELEI